MKWKCKDKDKKNEIKLKWKIWFAWYPVKVSKNKIIWLEYVYKRKRETIGGLLEGTILINEYKEDI